MLIVNDVVRSADLHSRPHAERPTHFHPFSHNLSCDVFAEASKRRTTELRVCSDFGRYYRVRLSEAFIERFRQPCQRHGSRSRPPGDTVDWKTACLSQGFRDLQRVYEFQLRRAASENTPVVMASQARIRSNAISVVRPSINQPAKTFLLLLNSPALHFAPASATST